MTASTKDLTHQIFDQVGFILGAAPVTGVRTSTVQAAALANTLPMPTAAPDSLGRAAAFDAALCASAHAAVMAAQAYLFATDGKPFAKQTADDAASLARLAKAYADVASFTVSTDAANMAVHFAAQAYKMF